MSEMILHQYAASPFSEKVRLLLGYKSASYSQVEIPVIMPRPFVIPLTGGYRRTPVLQVGSDIYCDTAIICRLIDAMYPENTIYPPQHEALDNAVAHWTDTFLFKVCVAVSFQPKALIDNPLFQNEDEAAAFMQDRAQLTAGGGDLSMDFDVAEPHFVTHLNNLDRELSQKPFLGGDSPSICDFSTYHICWFVYEREPLRDYFEPFPAFLDWYQRMAAFGHGDVTEVDGSTALDAAKNSQPEAVAEPVFLDDYQAGEEVSVIPIDYGLQPVTGSLLVSDLEEIAVQRSDPEVGEVVVHFPRMGFRVTR